MVPLRENDVTPRDCKIIQIFYPYKKEARRLPKLTFHAQRLRLMGHALLGAYCFIVVYP